MSMSTQPIPFFSDDIVIAVHSATDAKHVAHDVSLKAFAEGSPLRLESVVENGELIAYRQDGAFMQGPEVVSG